MNQLVKADQQQMTVKSLFGRDDVKKKFQELLGKKSSSFITSVLQIVASNQLLVKAEPASIYHSAAVAATLDLPLNNSLGFAFIIPYSIKQKDGTWKTVAQFQIGYKGFKQLALRSGQFSTLNETDVREGELKKYDRLTGEFEFEWIQEEKQRLLLPIIGYASYFKLLNGFEKINYMSVDGLKDHGLRFSQTFKKGHGLWKDDFDSMARKTVVKLNLSKNAPLSVDMQKAIIADQAVVKDADAIDVDYVDNDNTIVDKEAERIALMIDDCKTVEELKALQSQIPVEQQDLFNQRLAELAG